ncbi:MAG: toll/interleukin-1 receptor domain-containing protein [Anaerolineae bacterium]|nr:toll/interleukin-1 receptor domain-containing protein [Anaerolineae bacterium]
MSDAGQVIQAVEVVQHAPSHTIFVSYAREDWDELVKPLVDQLTEAGLDVWVDQKIIRGGENWWDAINTALESCGRMVLCVSPTALNSRFVKTEYRYFILNDKPLYPVILRETKLPPELAVIQYYRFNQRDQLIEELGRG